MELLKHERLHSTENLVAYVRHSGGAIELHEDYVVFYHNLFLNSKCVHGRYSAVINFDDIRAMYYKGIGWYPGFYIFFLKGMNHAHKFVLTKHFVWRAKKLNLELRPIYEFIFNKVQIAMKQDKYRKIQTFEEIKMQGNCPVCGELIVENSSFCSKCGHKLEEVQ